MHGNIKALLILAQVHTDEVDWVGFGQVFFRFAFKLNAGLVLVNGRFALGSNKFEHDIPSAGEHN